ncbi:unnamed protein product [Notodromas monacha]|uniref:Uncharacterized protein n=1 Tax=Notodromas monacha TaxID=399045 RepID=A0A7R9GCU7_9CRUS|nr:unnamed protein product [Notodromas monacha]CAG0916470.1 unnamed protein product [Notodromas monacha]
MTIGGYPKRGNPILGKDTRPSDVDNMPYTTLLYGNGPGYGVAGSGQDFHDDAGGADQHARHRRAAVLDSDHLWCRSLI